MGCIFRAPASLIWTNRSRSTPRRERDHLLYKELTKVKVESINLTYAGLVPQIQKSMLSKDVDALQPHIRAFVERAIILHRMPGMRWHPTHRDRPGSLKNRGSQHCRRGRDADQRPRRNGSRTRDQPSVAPLLYRPSADPRLVRLNRARLPHAPPSGGHPLRRRSAADHDYSSPRLVADGCDLRLRRADGRPAPPRHPADERAPAAAAGQGQHRARRGAQAGDDRDRRPRRRPRPGRRRRRRPGGVRGHRRRPAGQRHGDRAAPRRPGLVEGRRCVRRPAR